MDGKASAAICFVASTVIGYGALYSGVWYLLVAVGFAVGLAVRSKWTFKAPALFAGGVASTLLFLAPLFRGNLVKLVGAVGAAAGLDGPLLLLLLFAISGLMVLAGGLIGGSVWDFVGGGKGQS